MVWGIASSASVLLVAEPCPPPSDSGGGKLTRRCLGAGRCGGPQAPGRREHYTCQRVVSLASLSAQPLSDEARLSRWGCALVIDTGNRSHRWRIDTLPPASGADKAHIARSRSSSLHSPAAWADGHQRPLPTPATTGAEPCGSIGAVSDPRIAPYGSVRIGDVDTLAQVDPGNPDINDGAFHLVRRHFDIQAFGVNAASGNAGDEMIEEHHEADDEENQTNGHQELFAVMTGHALFTVDGEEIDAPAGTIVFVRDPTLIRAARATADDTTIFMVGGPTGIPYTVSRWETALP